jgi:formylglycine-generating enzyme required for sulfatase activity
MKYRHLFVFLLFSPALFANNIQVTNLSLVSENRLESHVLVQFDITWENSWRLNSGSANWDAAWIFVKFRVGNGEWQHANLHNTEYVTGAGTPAVIAPALMDDASAYHIETNPVTGVFLHRSEASSGTFTNTGMRLRWNYGADGIASGVNVDVRVYAIEMVYVPQGAFNAGGGGGTNAFTSTTINTANATTAPSGSGSLGGQAGGYPTGQTPPTSNAWPNGFNAFYCMKYEISQQQYVDFLNTLTQAQADARKANENSNRYAITGSSPGNYTTLLPYVACNFFSWADGAAYADWACLRPMTELEYEKACRGNQQPVPGEYAWGIAERATSQYSLVNTGQINEQIGSNYSVTAGNANYSGTNGSIEGPFRVGIFSANSENLNRITSGSSFWGIMELSGNLMERCISAGHYIGLLFTGKNGNGSLSAGGDADVENWPSTDAAGAGFRGGSWNVNAHELRVSDRSKNNFVTQNRLNWCGFRFVRNF